MCDKKIPFLYWPFEPYMVNDSDTNTMDGVVFRIFNESFVTCCGRPVDVAFHQLGDQMSVMTAIESKQQAFAMPIMVPHLAIQNAPQIFIRVFDHPGLSLITNPPESSSNVMLSGLKNVWPLLAALIILSGYASLVFWLAEFQAEQRAFSRTFHFGYFQAFWYCLISATTVGYGDKVPRSKLGKVCGVVWILVGVSIVSAFTASITTLMAQIQSGMFENIDLSSSNIGVLAGTVDEYMVVQMGGNVVTGTSLDELVTYLDKQNTSVSTHVTGIAVDPHHLRIYSADFSTDEYFIETQVTGPVTVGYLIKVNNDSTLRCFKQQAFFRQLYVNQWISQLTTHVPHRTESKADVAAKSIVRDTDKIMLGIAAAVLVGLVLSVWLVELLWARRRRKHSQRMLSPSKDSAFGNAHTHTPLASF